MEMDKINMRVLYYDYLGFEHRGTIVLIEPCNAPDVEPDDEEGTVCYVYIADDREEFNIHEFKGNALTTKYAEIRRSDEVIPVYAKEDL